MNQKNYNVCVQTCVTAYMQVSAIDPEDARSIVAEAFDLDEGFITAEILHRLHSYRKRLGFVSKFCATDEMDCSVEHSIFVNRENEETANQEQSVTLTIRSGDYYDDEPERYGRHDADDGCEDCEECEHRDECDHYTECNLCEDCRQPEEKCLLYLLGQPAELIPMSAVEECAAELGNQLVHECIPDTALFVTYNPCSILDVEDARYLIAPALVHGLVDNEPAPMTDEECVVAQKILTERTVTLTADGEEFHALKLFD